MTVTARKNLQQTQDHLMMTVYQKNKGTCLKVQAPETALYLWLQICLFRIYSYNISISIIRLGKNINIMKHLYIRNLYVQLKVQQLAVHVFICILYSSLFLALHVSGAICTHPQEHKLQHTAIGVCNGFSMLIPWSTYWLGHPHLTVLKVWGCPSQYLLQQINIPKPLHTPEAVCCSLCSWGWVQIALETCGAEK
jgi:hypothetical protein